MLETVRQIDRAKTLERQVLKNFISFLKTKLPICSSPWIRDTDRPRFNDKEGPRCKKTIYSDFFDTAQKKSQIPGNSMKRANVGIFISTMRIK